MVSLISFGLGMLSKIKGNKIPVKVENFISTDSSMSSSFSNIEMVYKATDDKVVASKNGAKYHYLWCSGAQSIKEENKIFFNSIEEAQKAGYTPASNCKGLK
jgi:methylphosphotriester-DNA--protein-cysteine methyltransferase